MELNELKKQLVQKVTQPIYIFVGEEIAVMDTYIKKIAELNGTTPTRIENLSSVYSKMQNNSIMKTKNVYVVRDDKEYMTQERVWDSMNSGTAQGDNVVIFVYTSLDKRSKFYKHHETNLTVFEKLHPQVLAKYIHKEIGLNEEDGVILAELCDNNFSKILLECDKIKHLANVSKLTIEEAFDVAIELELIYTPPTDVVFELVDSICKRNVDKAFELYEVMKGKGEGPLGVISLLYNNVRAMLLVQSAGNTKDITGRTGLTAFQVKLAKEKGTAYSIGELVRALRLIRETERGIKTGQIESNLAIDYILVNIM